MSSQPEKQGIDRPVVIKRHPFPVWTLAWSPDGAQIASAGKSREVWLWNASTGRVRLILRHSAPAVRALAWSPDGQCLAAGGDDGTIFLWDTSTGKARLTYTLHRRSVCVLAWSPDGSQIASGSEDSFLQIWDTANGKQMFSRRHGLYMNVIEEPNALAWSPDSKYLAVGGWFLILYLWDLTTGDLVEWMWDEDHVAFADTLVWPTHGQRILCDYSGMPLAFFKGDRLFAYSHARVEEEPVAAAPDGRYLAVSEYRMSGYRDHVIHIQTASWRNCKVRCTYSGHRQNITAIDWSPDGKHIASASADKMVHIWQPPALEGME